MLYEMPEIPFDLLTDVREFSLGPVVIFALIVVADQGDVVIGPTSGRLIVLVNVASPALVRAPQKEREDPGFPVRAPFP